MRREGPLLLCYVCKLEKPRDNFGRRNKGKYYRSSCRPCDALKTREYHLAHPERRTLEQEANRKTILKIQHSLTQADYEAMLDRQRGMCAICGATTPRMAGRQFFMIDHDHATGKIRGLLCSPCNLGLGSFGDRVDWLVSAAAYLLNQ
jgi:recombination endonuclease VII